MLASPFPLIEQYLASIINDRLSDASKSFAFCFVIVLFVHGMKALTSSLQTATSPELGKQSVVGARGRTRHHQPRWSRTSSEGSAEAVSKSSQLVKTGAAGSLTHSPLDWNRRMAEWKERMEGDLKVVQVNDSPVPPRLVL